MEFDSSESEDKNVTIQELSSSPVIAQSHLGSNAKYAKYAK